MSGLTRAQRIERAEQEVIRLTGSGNGGMRDRSFRMTVPAEPDRDSDLVLMDGLKAGREALDDRTRYALALHEIWQRDDLHVEELQSLARVALGYEAVEVPA